MVIFRTGYHIQSPVLIVTALSESTQKYDKILQLKSCLQVEQVQEYILIEQEKVEIAILSHRLGWQSSYYFLGNTVTFELLGLSVSIEDMYDHAQNSAMVQWLKKKCRPPSRALLLSKRDSQENGVSDPPS